jgi:RimJ/RimL family protein N-acetyltransferase
VNVESVILEGQQVRLEPLGLDHLEDLCAVGLAPDLWKLIPTRVQNAEDMRAYVELALRERTAGVCLPFATIAKSTGRAIGSTRFMNIERQHLRAEIGCTWIGAEWQRTRVNTEAKYLMLRHAFETWKCHRVELKTDSLNQRSRDAILRIGAKEEGTFRNHMVVQEGRVRDTVYFSIIDSEWPSVKRSLEEKLSANPVPPLGPPCPASFS